MKKVKFFPEDKTIIISDSDSILDAAINTGFFVPSVCGGRGKCGKCMVKIREGKIGKISDASKKMLGEELVEKGYVLACRETEFSEIEVEVVQDVSTLHIGKIKRRKINYGGFAIDLGTTTVGISLVDMEKGDRVVEASLLNPQFIYGQDVLSRVSFVGEKENNIKILQEVIKKAIKQVLTRILLEVEVKNLKKAVISGNTIMSYLFHGISPLKLVKYPFPVKTKIFLEERIEVKTRSGSFDVEIFTVPVIGPFVGGDITAGLVATNFKEQPLNSVFMDLGTNVEIAIKSSDGIIATSAPAGPAFEGGVIKFGMPALKGSISSAYVKDGRIGFSIIGEKNEPAGICGSGLFSLIELLYSEGVIDRGGTILSPEDIPSDLGNRVKVINGQKCFILFEGVNHKIYLTQEDIRNFQLAKSAGRTAIEILLKKNNITYDKISKIFVAGAMGLHIKPPTLINLNVLPLITEDRIIISGNTSLMGDERILKEDLYEYALDIAGKVEHIELSSVDEFKKLFPDFTAFR